MHDERRGSSRAGIRHAVDEPGVSDRPVSLLSPRIPDHHLPYRCSEAPRAAPNFLLKIIPHVDGTPRICELVEYHLIDIDLKGAWTGPAQLTLFSHALAPLAELPVLEVVSGLHILADLTLDLGKVVHDYLA